MAALPLPRLLAELEIGLLIDFAPWIDPCGDWQRYLRYLAFPSCWVGWTGFLVETASTARLLWREQDRAGTPLETQIKCGEFENGVRAFILAVEQRSSEARSIPPVSTEISKVDARSQRSIAG